ncbi:MAG: glycoside hydrolase family 16 protein [Myxococcales bacterium]|nr:glycoside hydrolase family 16 protein [Myxococcales bacterium]
MRTIRTLCVVMIGVAVGALATSCGSSDKVVSPPERWVLTMADEFDSGTSPSSELWTIATGYGPDNEGWGNDEWQEYTTSQDNVRVEGGNLVISALCPNPPCGKRDGSITSARIKTEGKAEQKYGRFEARIKLPEGQGLWPAFWMLGADFSEVGWPDCGEIDVMELFGQEPEVASGTLHGPGYFGAAPITTAFRLPDGESFADDFHVFAVEWDPGRITFSVDSQVYRIVNSSEVSGRGNWVFDHEFFVLLNLAVGGAAQSPSDTVFPAEMLVDYVRIFERPQ